MLIHVITNLSIGYGRMLKVFKVYVVKATSSKCIINDQFYRWDINTSFSWDPKSFVVHILTYILFIQAVFAWIQSGFRHKF
jgi:hypothetical protein